MLSCHRYMTNGDDGSSLSSSFLAFFFSLGFSSSGFFSFLGLFSSLGALSLFFSSLGA